MLPKLSSLDTLVLAEETKQLAEATFLKKQMYYNMRIKTVFRNARNIIMLASEGKKVMRARNQREFSFGLFESRAPYACSASALIPKLWLLCHHVSEC
jgi:hypothetical protein